MVGATTRGLTDIHLIDERSVAAAVRDVMTAQPWLDRVTDTAAKVRSSS